MKSARLMPAGGEGSRPAWRRRSFRFSCSWGVPMKLTLSGSSAVSTPSPYFIYGPGLPIGGDYGTILTYFVNRGRPTYGFSGMVPGMAVVGVEAFNLDFVVLAPVVYLFLDQSMVDRKSTRLNSSHLGISYAVFC